MRAHYMVPAAMGALAQDETGGSARIVGVILDDLRRILTHTVANVLNVQVPAVRPVKGMPGNQIHPAPKRRDDGVQHFTLPIGAGGQLEPPVLPGDAQPGVDLGRDRDLAVACS